MNQLPIHFRVVSGLALFTLAGSSWTAQAQTTWNGSLSGSWATPGNWTTTLPAGDLVTYGAGTGVGIAVANPTQTLDGTWSVLGFSVGNNAASPIVINAGTGGSITIGTSGILLNSGSGGNFTMNPDITMGGAQSFTTGTARGITVNNVANGGFLLTVNTAGATSTTAINGLLSGAGGLTKSGPGTLTVSGTGNTFGGVVTVGGGTLSFTKLSDGGVNSSLGNGSSALILNGGTLTYTGAGGDSTNRAIDMRAGAAINNNSATGAISFTAANVIQGGAASARTLTLGGANTGNNTFSSILGNSGTGANISTLQKSGAGRWIVGGTQAYTGATIINQGTLRVGGAAVLGGDATATGGTTDTGNIWFTSTNSNAALEFETAANLGPAPQIRFRNTGGTIGQGGALKYVGTTNQTVSKTIQCDTSIGIRLESDSVGGAITLNGAFNQTNRPLYLGGTGTGDNRLDTAFTGSGSVTKRDAGTWILGGANTYTGATTIAGGKLQVDGSTASAGLISVSAGSTLGGSGTAGNATLSDDAILSPGGTADHSLGLASLSLSTNTDLVFGLSSPLLPAWNDTVQVSGALTLAGQLNIAQQGGGAPVYDFTTAAPGAQWLLFTYGSGQLTDGGVTVASAPALAGGLNWAVDTSTDGSVFLTVVPEAGTAGLVALGLLLLRRRRA